MHKEHRMFTPDHLFITSNHPNILTLTKLQTNKHRNKQTNKQTHVLGCHSCFGSHNFEPTDCKIGQGHSSPPPLMILAKVIRIPIQPAVADLSSARLQAAVQSMEQASVEQARMDDSIICSGFCSISKSNQAGPPC